MKGKTWMHNGKTFRLIDFELSDDCLVILTENDYYRKPVQVAMKFLSECLRVADEPLRPPKETILQMSDSDVILKQARIVGSGIDTLIKMIENRQMTAMLNK